jgi:hypothetical protein
MRARKRHTFTVLFRTLERKRVKDERFTQTERKEEENTFRQTRDLGFTRLKETSRSRAHHHPKGTINSGLAAIAQESKS